MRRTEELKDVGRAEMEEMKEEGGIAVNDRLGPGKESVR